MIENGLETLLLFLKCVQTIPIGQNKIEQYYQPIPRQLHIWPLDGYPISSVDLTVSPKTTWASTSVLQSICVYKFVYEYIRRCRLGQLKHGIQGWRQHFRIKVWKAKILGSFYEEFELNLLLKKMHIQHITARNWNWVLLLLCLYAFSYNVIKN